LKPPRGDAAQRQRGAVTIDKPPRGDAAQRQRGVHMSRIRIITLMHVILVLLTQLSLSYSQSYDYKIIFGSDWIRAVDFENENRIWMEPLLEKHNISYPLAIAVVFPELVRYSALRDKMEITLLKALYINLGEEYANFSIGRFQMKPSFAEHIHKEAASVLGRREAKILKNKNKDDDIKNFRKSIVTDLEDPVKQFSYLIAFLKICEKKFNTGTMNEHERLKFIATAYNYGIDKSFEEIQNMTDVKFFNTKLFKTDNYSYADVSLFWYVKYMEEKNQ
jgi:hypothetical protein